MVVRVRGGFGAVVEADGRQDRQYVVFPADGGQLQDIGHVEAVTLCGLSGQQTPEFGQPVTLADGRVVRRWA